MFKKLLLLITTPFFFLASYGNENNLIYKWDFDKSGKNLSDIKIKTENVEFTEAKIGIGAKFNGKNSIIRITPNEKLNNIQSSFTIVLWFKVLGAGPEAKVFMTLLSKNSSGRGYNDPFNFGVWCANTDGTQKVAEKSLWARIGNGKSAIEIRTGGNVDDGRFHQGALVINKEAGIAYIYLDGMEAAKKTLPPDWQTYKNNDAMIIGVWPEYANNFDGIIDDVKIYNAALSPEEIMRHYISGMMKSGNTSQTPTFTVPVIQKRPVIDGNFSEAEWTDAEKIDGFMNRRQLLSEKKAMTYITHDKNMLYVAVVTDTWNGKLKAEAQNNDNSVLMDDSIEFAGVNEHSSYHITVNSKGKFLETVNNKQTTAETEANFSSGISKDKWFFEMSIPLKYLGITSFRNGQTFKFNVARNYMNPPMNAFDVSVKEKFTDTIAGALDETGNYAVCILKDKSAVVSLLLGEHFDIGEVSSVIEVKNNQVNDVIKSTLEIIKAEKCIERQESKNDKNNFKIKIDKSFEISDEPVIANLKIQSLSSDNNILFYRNIPFLVNNNIFDFDYIVDRAGNKLILDVKKYVISAFGADRNILVELTNKEGKLEFKELVKNYKSADQFTQINIPLNSLPDMVPLVIKVSLVDKDNKCISAKECDFIRMESAEGLNCTIGEDNTVPLPWTPLKYNDEFSIECWNREYDFKDAVIINKIKNAGKDILNGPLAFNVSQNGRILQWGNLVQNYLEKRDDSSVIMSEAVAGDMKLTCKITMEFDGMLRIDGKLSSAKSEKIDAVALEIPIKNEIAEYLYASRGENLNLSYCGDWETRIGKLGNYWKGRFTPFVWLGDEDKGLVWFAENDKGWENSKEDAEIEIMKKGDRTILRINYADKNFELSKPFEFTFGLQATPVRPRPSDWRKIRYGTFNDCKGASSIIVGWSGRRPNSNIYWGLKYDYDKLGREVSHAKKLEYKCILPYSFPQIGDGDSPEIRYYLEDWACEKSDGHARKYPLEWKSDTKEFPFAYLSYASKSYHNYWIYTFYNLLKNVPELTGIYYDGAIVASSNNPKQNCLYVKNGKECGTYPIFAARDFYKRVYKMVKGFNKDNIVMGHISCTRGIPCESFFDVVLDGEYLAGELSSKNYDYVNVIPLDVWRTQFTARQLGCIPVFLPQLDRAFFQNAKKIADMKSVYAQSTRTLMSMLLIHDISIMKYLSDSDETTNYLKRLDEFGVVESTFYPYWSSQNMITSFSDDVKISVYKNKDKILLGIADISDKNLQGDIKLNPTALNISGNFKAKSLVTGKDIQVENNILKSVQVNHKDYEMIVISQ